MVSGYSRPVRLPLMPPRSSPAADSPIQFRPSPDQRRWLEAERQRRRLPVSSLLRLLIEDAMERQHAAQAASPSTRGR
jgi:hypothetical protein